MCHVSGCTIGVIYSYDYFDHANTIAWTRSGDEQHSGCAVILTNGSEGSKVMDVGKVRCSFSARHFLTSLQEHAGEVWSDVLGWHSGEVTINEDGKAEFRCSVSSLFAVGCLSDSVE